MLDEKLAHGYSRQALHRIMKADNSLESTVETPLKPLGNRAAEGRIIRPNDFNQAAKAMMAVTHNDAAFIDGEYTPMRSSAVSRAKDTRGVLINRRLESRRTRSVAGNSDPTTGMACFVNNALFTAERKQLLLYYFLSPFVFYQHALKRFYERSHFAEAELPPVNRIMGQVLDHAMLYLLTARHIDKLLFQRDAVIPWFTEGESGSVLQGCFLSQFVTLPNDVDVGVCLTVGRQNHDVTLTWDGTSGVAVHTFYGRNYLNHEQEQALGQLDEWLSQHRTCFNGSRPIWNGLSYANANDDDLTLFTEFRAILGSTGFEDLFQHARRLRETGTVKRIEFTEEELE